MPNKLSLEQMLKIIKIRVEKGPGKEPGYHRIADKTGVHWLTVRKYIKKFEEI